MRCIRISVWVGETRRLLHLDEHRAAGMPATKAGARVRGVRGYSCLDLERELSWMSARGSGRRGSILPNPVLHGDIVGRPLTPAGLR